jgi:D-glycero-alpha-D-manno-heptose-7-phosphate kinase
VRIASSAPTRIDLAGGTYDIWPLYLFHDGAQTINAAISLRAHATLTSRADRRVILISEDTGERVEAPQAADLDVDRLPLLARLVRYFDASGLELTSRSDSPVGAGIAGSSAMNIAVTGALAAWTKRDLSDDQLMAIAMNIEAQVIHVPTGAQDYRPAVYGGVSAVELGIAGVRRVALHVDPQELGDHLVLAYTGASRNSGINNWDVMQRRIGGDADVTMAFAGIRDAALGMRAALEARDWPAASRHLANEWDCRKRLAPGVTMPEIEKMFDRAKTAGATAGKICGAGGGGCFFCLVDPERRDPVRDAIASAGAQVLDFRVEPDGLRIERSTP